MSRYISASLSLYCGFISNCAGDIPPIVEYILDIL